MKKSILIVLVVLLLLLTACQPAQESNTDPAGSTPSSSSITPPSSSAVPPTSTPATSVPATEPPEPANTGYAHIYEGDYPWLSVDPDFSGCTVGYLYWIAIATSKVTPIVEEAVLSVVQEGAYVYYVKAAEPSKIYRALIGEFSQQELIHETVYGKIGDMTIYPGIENYLQFVADNTKFVVFDFDTGVETVLMEQYYINIAYMDGTDGTLGNMIWFEGKHTAEDPPYSQFFYDRETGEIELDTRL